MKIGTTEQCFWLHPPCLLVIYAYIHDQNRFFRVVVASVIIMAGLSVGPSSRVGASFDQPGDSVADLRLIALFVRA